MTDLEKIRQTIASDQHAITFTTMAGYRKWLLREIEAIKNPMKREGDLSRRKASKWVESIQSDLKKSIAKVKELEKDKNNG